MSIKVSNLTLSKFNNLSLKDLLYNKNAIEEDKEYLVSSKGKTVEPSVNPNDNLVIKRFRSTQKDSKASLYVNYDNKDYSFEILNVPKYYTVTLGVQILSETKEKQVKSLFKIPDPSKVYFRFYVGVINAYGKVVEDLSKDYYFCKGMNINITLPDGIQSDMKIYKRGTKGMKYDTDLKYESENTYSAVLKSDSFEFDVRGAKEKATSSSNNTPWIIAVSVLGGLLLIIILIIIFRYFFYNPKDTKVEKGYTESLIDEMVRQKRARDKEIAYWQGEAQYYAGGNYEPDFLYDFGKLPQQYQGNEGDSLLTGDYYIPKASSNYVEVPKPYNLSKRRAISAAEFNERVTRNLSGKSKYNPYNY